MVNAVSVKEIGESTATNNKGRNTNFEQSARATDDYTEKEAYRYPAEPLHASICRSGFLCLRNRSQVKFLKSY
jgi:hypothetical protein